MDVFNKADDAMYENKRKMKGLKQWEVKKENLPTMAGHYGQTAMTEVRFT